MFCGFCFNSRLYNYFVPDLDFDDNNDYSVTIIGFGADGHRLSFCSGLGLAPRIESECWNDKAGWFRTAQYFPKFCPECGRKIIEYDKREKE